MNMPVEKSKVSLLIPCYNGEKFLKQCFHCILQQTYNNVEVIIINDGSTDRSAQIITSFSEPISQRGYSFVYLSKNNGGAASAVDLGLKYVSWNYLMLYDVDDILMKDAIKLKAEFLDNHPEYAMVRNNGYYVKAKNLKQNSYLFIRNKKEKQNESIFEDILYGKTNNWTGTYMIRSHHLFNHIKDKSIFISPWGQNIQLMLPVAYHYKSGFIDKPLMRYVDHGSSVSRTNNPWRELELFDGYKENRMEVIRSMDIPESEKQNLYKKIDTLYKHIRLRWASQYNKKDILAQEFISLKKDGELTWNDHIYYYFGKNKRTSSIYQRVLYLVKMMHCIFYKCEGKVLRHDPLY